MKNKLISIIAAGFLALLAAFVLPGTVRAEETEPHSGWQKEEDGSWYYYDSDGKKVQGWQTIGKARYYFDKARDCRMATGFYKIGGASYYFMDPSYTAYNPDKEGRMLTGFKTIGGVKYYFVDSQYPYSTQTGRMLTGFKTIGGKKYYFVDSQYPYSKMTGRMLTGRKTIGGKVYLFNDRGVMRYGWIRYGGKWLFFNKSGVNVVPVVVLDPGHSSQVAGGQEPIGPGATETKDADTSGTRGISTGIYEYQLAFTVSTKLKKELEARGYKVIMTRTSNKGTYSCIERAQVANNNKADIFVRVHANGSSDRSRTGAMTICITKKNPYIPKMYSASRLLSELVLDSYLTSVGSIKNEGIWETDTMSGNNWSKVPTTLIELGYMTNAKEDKLMATAACQSKMVKGIADGIENYFRRTW